MKQQTGPNNKVKYCYQIVNKYKSYLGEYNIDYLAYQPICTSGKDNSILHSHNYNKKIIDNSLILLDIGCKYNYYCSDITRTIPVSGKFNKIQKDTYKIVPAISVDTAVQLIYPRFLLSRGSFNKNLDLIQFTFK